MARAWPLPTAQFAERLLIRSVSWQLVEVVASSGYGNGDPLDVELAPARWEATVALANMSQFEAVEQRALIQMHLRPGRPFVLFNRAIPGPLLDPQGAAITGHMPVVHTIGAEGRSLRVNGLPGSYGLRVGDMLELRYGTNRRSLHQVGEAATASAGGLTPAFDLDPNVPVGVEVGDTVRLVRAGAMMIRVPGSYDPGQSERAIVSGMGFRAVQIRGSW